MLFPYPIICLLSLSITSQHYNEYNKELRQERSRPTYVPVNGVHSREHHGSQSSSDHNSGLSTPSTLSPGDTFNLQEEFEKVGAISSFTHNSV